MRVPFPARFRGPVLPGFVAALLAAALALPMPALAQIDTLEIGPGTFVGSPVVASVPVGDIMPLHGVVHVAWTRNRALRHAWKNPDPWQIETVADSALSYDLAVRGDGLAVVAFADGSGRLVLGERTPTAWELDTLAVYPGSSLSVSLALDHEAAIAFLETPPGGPVRLRYTHRDGALWTLSLLDPDVGNGTRPSLAFDPVGRPKLAYVRAATTSVGSELVLLEGETANGPFNSAVVDTEGVGPVALVWERTWNRPFVNYRARHWDTQWAEYRVAYRDNLGGWPWQVIGEPGASDLVAAVSLALDPLGALGAAWLSVTSVAPQSSQEHETGGCGYVDTGNVNLSRQLAGVPSGAFTHGQLPHAFDPPDAIFGGRAVSSHEPRTFDVCWRAPRIACPPFAILYGEFSSGVTGVVGEAGRGVTGLELAPSPRRGAAPLRLRWTQPRAAAARLELHDVSGRVLAGLDAGERPAGPNELTWRTREVSPGLYWVTLRLDGVRSATKVLVSR